MISDNPLCSVSKQSSSRHKSHHKQEISSWIISSLLSCSSDMTKSLWQKLVENKFAKIFSTDCRLERLVKSLLIKFLWKFFSRLPLQSTSDPENHMFSSSRLQVVSSRVLHACFVYILSCGSKGIVSTNHIQDIIPSRWIFNLQVFPRFKEPSTRSVSVEGFWRILGGKRASSHISLESKCDNWYFR